MAFIKVVGQTEAEGELAKAYARVAGKRGKVSNVLAAQSLDPGALVAHLNLYSQVMYSRGGLSRREREVMALTISTDNACDYCVAHHRAALAAHTSVGFAAILASGNQPGEMTSRERALVAFARLHTRAPSADPRAVAALHTAGLSDLEVLQAAQVVAYFNFVTRLALALGVVLDDDRGDEGYRY